MEPDTSAWSNLVELFHCLGGAQCTLVKDADSGFGLAFVIVLALNIGGVVLTHMGLVAALQLVPEQRRESAPAKSRKSSILGTPISVLLGLAPACLWFYLWLAYALPESAGQSHITWMVTTPLYTLVLMTGVVGTVAAICFIAGTAASTYWQAGDAASRPQPIARIAANRWAWGALLVAVTGILIGWHALYEATPELAAGPFGRGPQWFQDAVSVWTLRAPVTVLWELAKALATIPGIVVFAGLGLLSLVLPRTSTTLGTEEGSAASWASAVTTTAVGNIAGLVTGTCVTIVVGLLAMAVVALALLFFAAYVMAYALVLAFLGALVVNALKR